MIIEKRLEINAIQLTSTNYKEFKKYVTEVKSWSISPIQSILLGRYGCFISEGVLDIPLYENDYVIFSNNSIIEIVAEERFNAKYKTIQTENKTLTAKLIGYASHHNGIIPDWSCPDCNKNIKKDFSFCPYCSSSINFPKIEVADCTFGYHRLK